MLKLIACWDLKEHDIIIIKNHKGEISTQFPESANLEKSSFTLKQLCPDAVVVLGARL